MTDDNNEEGRCPCTPPGPGRHLDPCLAGFLKFPRSTHMAHVRSLPSDYVDVQAQSYDPNYISDISKKMQVPERIICMDEMPRGGGGALENAGYYDPGSGRQFTAMSVPDRIIVAGDNRHIGMREGLRRSPLDQAFTGGPPPNLVELTTPPHVLTLEQGFPSVQQESDVTGEGQGEGHGVAHDRQMVANGHLAAPVSYVPGWSPSDSLLVSEDVNEATMLRTQVAKLTRRVMVIEQDTQRRAQREMGLYVALFGYFVWKVFVSSFFRRGV